LEDIRRSSQKNGLREEAAFALGEKLAFGEFEEELHDEMRKGKLWDLSYPEELH